MNVADTENPPTGPQVIAEGPFAGWKTWSTGSDPYETAIGPFYFKTEAGASLSAFEPRRDHLNGAGSIHGGLLMSFADFTLFTIAHEALEGVRAVTLTCNCEFLSAGGLGATVEARGEVLRETRSLIFVRGVMTQGDRPLLAFSGTLKKIGPWPSAA